jgi:hypothetical protein
MPFSIPILLFITMILFFRIIVGTWIMHTDIIVMSCMYHIVQYITLSNYRCIPNVSTTSELESSLSSLNIYKAATPTQIKIM